MTGSKSSAPYILKGCHTTELPESTHQTKAHCKFHSKIITFAVYKYTRGGHGPALKKSSIP